MATSAHDIAALIAAASPDELDALERRYADDPRKQVARALERALKARDALASEEARVRALYDLQRELGGDGIILGVDEVGRGAVAGLLTVCAVALPDEPIILGLNDSKRLTPKRREELAVRIREHAVALGICHIPPEEIDRRGMAVALRLAMAGAIEATGIDPDCVLIDGNPVHVHPRERCVVKGDARIAAISAASIVAKVTRDALMDDLDRDYPGYGFAKSKGYASPEHIDAIRSHGLTPVHRATFCGNFVEAPRLF